MDIKLLLTVGGTVFLASCEYACKLAGRGQPADAAQPTLPG